ncbi:MAG: hypothetical protein WCQ32_02505 [bacterium]
MDPILDKRLSALEAAIEENTIILKRMRSAQRIATAFRMFYWVMIFLLGFGALYFVKPYLGQLGAVFNTGGGTDVRNLTGILSQLKGDSK